MCHVYKPLHTEDTLLKFCINTSHPARSVQRYSSVYSYQFLWHHPFCEKTPHHSDIDF